MKDLEKLFNKGESGGFMCAQNGRLKGKLIKDGKPVRDIIAPQNKPFKVKFD